MLSTPPAVYYIGEGGTTSGSDGIHALAHAPDWYPNISGTFLYSWVMETGYWAPGCRYWVQVGWMASGGKVYAAEQDYVEPACNGGWTAYRTYQNFNLNTNHEFEILYYGNNNWQVTIDNTIVNRVNLPSGNTAEAQVFVETDGINSMPDLTTNNIEAHLNGTWGGFSGGCWSEANYPLVFAAYEPCDYFVTRK